MYCQPLDDALTILILMLIRGMVDWFYNHNLCLAMFSMSTGLSQGTITIRLSKCVVFRNA